MVTSIKNKLKELFKVMQRNYAIDAVKFIAAILVVFIHSSAFMVSEEVATFGNYHWWRPLMNIAVPFFFAASGYFIAQKPINYLKKYASRIFGIFLVATGFYLVGNTLVAILDALVNQENIVMSAFTYWKDLELVTLLNGKFGSVHLWYLMATVIAVVVLYILKKLNFSFKQEVFFSIILFMIILLPDIAQLQIFAYGGFPKALMYLVIGEAVYRNRARLKSDGWLLTLGGLAIYMGSAYILLTTDTYIGEVGMITFITGVLIFCHRHPGSNQSLAKLGQLSMPVYILHNFMITIFVRIIPIIPFIPFENPVVKTITTVVFAVLASICLYPMYRDYFSEPLNQFFIKGKNRYKIKELFN